MAELAADDLPDVIRNRFADDDAAQSSIDAALAAARRYCGWYVSPVQNGVTLDVDGPGGRALSLPTLNLLAVTAVTENDIVVDVANLRWSRRKGTVHKRGFGCWTHHEGAIEVTITHGYTEVEAADWRRAVVRLVDAMSLEDVTETERDSADLIRKRVDDVEYQWAVGLITSDQRLASMFSQFRILPSP